MLSDQPESGPGVYVIGIDKAENTGPIYEALRQAGCAWRGQALSLNEALRQLELVKDEVDLVVVRADLARRGEEVALLEPIRRWPLVVLLGVARADRQAAIAQLPNVRQVLVVPPYDFHTLGMIQVKKSGPAESVLPPAVATVTPARAEVMISAPLPTARESRPVTPGSSTCGAARTRLAFFGMRGGVGTSTAALRAAQLLAGQGLRVAVFDAAQRGDLHVMLGGDPSPQPMQHNLITVYLGEPAEEIVEPYEALVIDGGRRRGTFNAQWIEVSRPLDDNALRRLIGLPPEDQTGEARPARRLVLPRILSIEVTD